MENIGDILSKHFDIALQKLDYYDKISVYYKQNSKVFYCNGEYIYYGCINMCKMINKDIYDLINEIIDNLELGELFEAYFYKKDKTLRFIVTSEYIRKSVSTIVMKKLVNVDREKKNILVDFSYTNIAKEMHTGHLRSTIIGDSICRLFIHLDHKVYRINHVGDYGLRFGMLIQYIIQFNEDVNKYTISDLHQWRVNAKKIYDSDDTFKQNSDQQVINLQNKVPKIVKIWKTIKQVYRESYNSIYNRLNIRLDEVSESFYEPFINDLIVELEQKGLISIEEGKKVIYVPEMETSITIVKSNGTHTYDTVDLAAIRYRLCDLKVNDIYYVVGSPQINHFDLIFAVARLAGWLTNQTVKLIYFDSVLDENCKLIDLLDASVKHTTKIIEQVRKEREQTNKKRNKVIDLAYTEEENDKIINSIAYGCIKYGYLSITRTSNYEFSFDKMLNLKGNTIVYLQYIYVRITSILNKVNLDEHIMKINEFALVDETELLLYNNVLHFPEIFYWTRDTLMFHMLCKYVYQLCKSFNTFINKCRCIEMDKKKALENVHTNRVILCYCVRRVLDCCFNILGINVVEKI